MYYKIYCNIILYHHNNICSINCSIYLLSTEESKMLCLLYLPLYVPVVLNMRNKYVCVINCLLNESSTFTNPFINSRKIIISLFPPWFPGLHLDMCQSLFFIFITDHYFVLIFHLCNNTMIYETCQCFVSLLLPHCHN